MEEASASLESSKFSLSSWLELLPQYSVYIWPVLIVVVVLYLNWPGVRDWLERKTGVAEKKRADQQRNDALRAARLKQQQELEEAAARDGTPDAPAPKPAANKKPKPMYDPEEHLKRSHSNDDDNDFMPLGGGGGGYARVPHRRPGCGGGGCK